MNVWISNYGIHLQFTIHFIYDRDKWFLLIEVTVTYVDLATLLGAVAVADDKLCR